jgi:hypothetical protein
MRELPRPRRVSALQNLHPGLLIPADLDAPKEVSAAADNARAAWDAYERTLTALREVEQDVEEAPGLDAAADAEALQRGEDLPEPSLPARRKALAEANRGKLAAEENLRAALYMQADAMRAGYGEWVASLQERVEQKVAAVCQLIDQVRDEFAALDKDRALLWALRGFNGDPASWDLHSPRPGAEQRRQERAESNLRSSSELQPNSAVQRDLYTLTAALAMLAEEES